MEGHVILKSLQASSGAGAQKVLKDSTVSKRPMLDHSRYQQFSPTIPCCPQTPPRYMSVGTQYCSNISFQDTSISPGLTSPFPVLGGFQEFRLTLAYSIQVGFNMLQLIPVDSGHFTYTLRRESCYKIYKYAQVNQIYEYDNSACSGCSQVLMTFFAIFEMSHGFEHI